MRIHAITLKNIRAVEQLKLNDIPDTGVVLISGDNEAGKSTVLDALDLVLTTKHSSAGRRVKALQPAGKDVGPEVELNATVGPYTFTIHKVFLRKKSSVLTITAPRNEQFTGREADEKLENILDENLDTALASTLFLRQGNLDPEIAAAGIPTITRTLDAGMEGGHGHATAATGGEDTELMQRIEEQYGAYFTAKGAKKSSYSMLEKSVASAEDDLTDLRAEVDRLSGYVEEVASRETEIAEFSAELPEALAEEEARARESAAAQALAQQVEAAQAAVQRAEVDVARARDDVESRELVRRRLAELTAEADKLNTDLATARESASAEAQRVAELTSARDEAKQRVDTARTAVKNAEAAREQVRVTLRAAELRDVVSRLDAADEEIGSLRSRQPEKTVTDADVRAAEKAREDLSLAQRLRDATAAKLEISGPAATQLRIDGDTVDFGGNATVGIHDGTRVALNEVEVIYHAAHGAEEETDTLAEAQRTLSDLLEKLGCDDVDAVRQLRDQHQELATSLQAALRRREDILASRDAEELRAEYARLREQLAEQEESDTAGAEVEQDGEAKAEQTLTQAREELEEATTAYEQAEAALKPWTEMKEAKAVAVLEARVDSKAGEISGAEADIAAREEKTSDAELHTALTRATQARDSAAAESAQYERQLAEANPELVNDLLEGARVRVRNLRERMVAAEKKVAELSGRIEQASGVAEKADRAEAHLEDRRTELASMNRRAEAARLLYETMVRHRDEARARYAAPFAQALNRYAARIFGPDVQFTLGESLEIEARTLSGTTVALTELSGGAKEQLALLVRFAIAELAGNGPAGQTSTPVIIDDALGATDLPRLQRMNSLLNLVGKQSQVFVLTCFPRRFDWIEPAKTATISELKEVVQ